MSDDGRDLVLLVGSERSCRDYEMRHPASTVRYEHVHDARTAYQLRPPYTIVTCHMNDESHFEVLRYLDRWGTTNESLAAPPETKP